MIACRISPVWCLAQTDSCGAEGIFIYFCIFLSFYNHKIRSYTIHVINLEFIIEHRQRIVRRNLLPSDLFVNDLKHYLSENIDGLQSVWSEATAEVSRWQPRITHHVCNGSYNYIGLSSSSVINRAVET